MLKTLERLKQKKPCFQQYNPAMGRDLPLDQIMIAEPFHIRCIRLTFSREKTRLDAHQLHLSRDQNFRSSSSKVDAVGALLSNKKKSLLLLIFSLSEFVIHVIFISLY